MEKTVKLKKEELTIEQQIQAIKSSGGENLKLSEQAQIRELQFEQNRLDLKKKQAELDAKNPYNTDNTEQFQQLNQQDIISDETLKNISPTIDLKLNITEEELSKIREQAIIELQAKMDVNAALIAANAAVDVVQSQVKPIIIPIEYQINDSINDEALQKGAR